MLYNAENLHGGDNIYEDKITLDYSININPFGTPKEVQQALKQSADSVNNYPDPYCRKLVRAISEYEQIPQENIICGNGAAEVIYHYCMAVQSKKCLELAPTFSEYSLGIKAAGETEIIRYQLDCENGFLPDDGFIEFLKKTAPDTVFLCNPNNPTGRCIPEMVMDQVLDICRENEIRLFVDECFLELSDKGRSVKKYLKDCPNLFILKAFTKNFGMPGVRLGYGLCSDAELLKKISEYSQPWNISVMAQAAGEAAVKCGYFIEKAVTIIAQERIYLSEKMAEAGLKVYPSDTNFILFQGPIGLDTCLKKKGISIRNCGNFEGLKEGWYRIAVKLHEENLVFIGALQEVLAGNK